MAFNPLGKARWGTGDASEALVTAYLSGQGFDVYVPTSARARCDLVYLTPAAIRVQVKTGTLSKSGTHKYEQCRLQTQGYGHVGPTRTYSADEIDELWVVGTSLWRFPVSEIEGLTSLCLSTDNPNPRPMRKGYDPTQRVVLPGTWQNPVRNLLS